MADQPHSHDILPEGSDPGEPSYQAASPQPAAAVKDYDVAIVGASLAGCATAIMLARTGARVALVEKSPDPNAFKRICTHYIQSSAVPTLERLGLLEPMMRRGAPRACSPLDPLGLDRAATRHHRPGRCEPPPREARPADTRDGRANAERRVDSRPHGR